MWLAFIVIAVIVGAILGIAGAGIYAIPIVLLLLGGALFLFMKQGAETATGRATPGADAGETPQDTTSAGVHQRTGAAHPGQEHMVPGQR
jgi:uncharacterized membrane protein YfcA